MKAANPTRQHQQADNWHARWETDTRWYEAFVSLDLFQTWTVTKAWGGKGSRRHGQQIEIADSRDEALARLERIHRQRISRHPPYRRIK